MSDHITVRPARADELHTVAELWDEASRWLGSRGLDQWQYPARRKTTAHNIAAGVSAGWSRRAAAPSGPSRLTTAPTRSSGGPRTTQTMRCTCTAWSPSAKWPAERSVPPCSTGQAAARRHWASDGFGSMHGALIPVYTGTTPSEDSNSCAQSSFHTGRPEHFSSDRLASHSNKGHQSSNSARPGQVQDPEVYRRRRTV